MPIFNIKFSGNICYRKINLTKSPASDVGSDSNADVRNLDSGQSHVHIGGLIPQRYNVQEQVAIVTLISGS
jgi:hypothetical protein